MYHTVHVLLDQIASLRSSGRSYFVLAIRAYHFRPKIQVIQAMVPGIIFFLFSEKYPGNLVKVPGTFRQK